MRKINASEQNICLTGVLFSRLESWTHDVLRIGSQSWY